MFDAVTTSLRYAPGVKIVPFGYRVNTEDTEIQGKLCQGILRNSTMQQLDVYNCCSPVLAFTLRYPPAEL